MLIPSPAGSNRSNLKGGGAPAREPARASDSPPHGDDGTASSGQTVDSEMTIARRLRLVFVLMLMLMLIFCS
jgi:hypothetical protein